MTDQTAMTLAAALEQWLKVKTAGRGLSPHTMSALTSPTFAAHLLGADARTAMPRTASTSPI